ncbi:unnamed protein product [Didymodactylos carnosus]|uniref:Acetyl-coenzyme A transporter 1 n=1 Tax=Didymodactylos carnosus TaxID=1234261 RepID=A0A815J272_9BILA|nr:unnamed protein product [Didymodactylos carnosus]CAF4261940.1 unnamed protein product [Didymodactylos carnosus]
MTDIRHRSTNKSKPQEDDATGESYLMSAKTVGESSSEQESDGSDDRDKEHQPLHQQISENEIILERYPSKSATSDTNPPNKQDWRKDRSSILLLLFLYLLQGIPLGMAASIPLIIQTFGASWSQQATFSFAFWPFSLKLIWAPIVDALYLKRFGRRKTWLIPMQYLIGITMLILSYNITSLVTAANTSHSHIYLLTAVFFGLSFLAATQDICVDGWALSMLSRYKMGQTAGYFLGNVIFLSLESKDFSNRYIRKLFLLPEANHGLVTLPGFLFFWGFIFIISTTFIALFKHEEDDTVHSDEPHFGIIETYKILFKLLKLSCVREIAIILLTVKIGFAATDSMTGLELLQRGVTTDSLALLAIPLTPLQIILPFIISRYTAGPKPLRLFINSYPPRLLMGIIMALFVYLTPYFQNYNKTFPWYYYGIAIVIYAIHQVFVYNMFVSQMSFYATVSDPKVGGTYMTLLNTLSNLGTVWISTAVLYAADYLTWKTCSLSDTKCYTPEEEKKCQMLGGFCTHAHIDSYYLEVIFCTIVGIIWLLWKYRAIDRLQNLPARAWQVRESYIASMNDDSDENSDNLANKTD